MYFQYEQNDNNTQYFYSLNLGEIMSLAAIENHKAIDQNYLNQFFLEGMNSKLWKGDNPEITFR